MAFQEFTGKEYLKIDIANNFGLDKLTWNERIAWFDAHEQVLDALVQKAEEPALFFAGVQAWEKAKAGQPTGYPISLDATSSGIQILAVLAGDREAARLCNVIDTGKREDAYTGIYLDMTQKLGDGAKIDRKQTKNAIMTAFYSSTAVPKRVFGEGKLLELFYNTMQERAPGAWEINETMLKIWDNNALENSWVLPDNFNAIIKVMGEVKENVHFLNEPFEVKYTVNMPIEGGRSLGANMTHSIDGMIVREMVRRCSYDPKRVKAVKRACVAKTQGKRTDRNQDKMVMLLWAHFLESSFLSARILDYLDNENIGHVWTGTISQLILDLPEKPFELITIHDCFRCLPNYGNDLRRQYNNLLAEIADSDLLAYIVSQIVGRKVTVTKLDPHLGRDVRETNYALS